MASGGSGGDANGFGVGLPSTAPNADMIRLAMEVCEKDDKSEWCEYAMHQARPPFLCRRIRGVFGLVDIVGIVGLCR